MKPVIRLDELADIDVGFLYLASAENLLPARLQMALTLGFHIILACLGVGLPVLMLAAEWRFLRTSDELWRTIARRWSKSFAVMFAIGAVTGTMLSFELGLLWPDFMGTWGAVIGLPFTMEGFAFFLEAIFAGIYLYGWDKLPPRVHWVTGLPIAISGFFSAFFVVTANAWMNAPAGFQMVNGELVEVDPIAAMFNTATAAQTSHMIIAAYLVTGFTVAAYYAYRILRGCDNTYNRRALTLALALAIPLVPIQMAVGDWSAKVVAKSQPIKFAAMESLYHTTKRAPLHIGGIPDEANETVAYSIEVPGALSFLAHMDFDAEVQGLEEVPREDRPPVLVVHLAFQVMVGIGVLMLALGGWVALALWKHHAIPQSRIFLLSLVLMGPLSVIALEAGWIVTEVGRQPWIVHGWMRTSEAVTSAPGVWGVFWLTIGVYSALGVTLTIVLMRLAAIPLPEDQRGT